MTALDALDVLEDLREEYGCLDDLLDRALAYHPRVRELLSGRYTSTGARIREIEDKLGSIEVAI